MSTPLRNRPRAAMVLAALALTAACGTTVPSTTAGGSVPADALTGAELGSGTGPDDQSLGQPVAPGAAGAGTPPGSALPGAAAGGGTSVAGAGPASGSGTARPGDSQGPGSSSTAGGAPGVATTARGVSATEIRIGFSVIEGANESAGALGVTGTETGNGQRQAEAAVDIVNAAGGVAGRKIKPVFDKVRASPDSNPVALAQASCEFFKDAKVFAVMGNYFGFAPASACVEKAGIPSFTSYPVAPVDRKYFRDFPSQLDVSALPLDDVAQLVGSGFAGTDYCGKDARIGLLRYDAPEYDRAVKGSFLSAVRRCGSFDASKHDIRIRPAQNTQDNAQVSSECQNAVLRFKTDGINRVMVLDAGGGLTLFCLTAAANQNYTPRYGLTSLSGGQGLADQGPGIQAQLAGAVSIGFIPDLDTPQPPDWPERASCLREMAKRQITPASVADRIGILALCDAVQSFKASVERSGQVLSTQSAVAGYGALGTSYVSTVSGPTRLAPDRHHGTQSWRPTAFDSACGCFRYTGPARSVG